MLKKQKLIVGIGYYILAVLVALFFYREDSVSSEFVQMVYSVLFLFVVPMLIIKREFINKNKFIKQGLQDYNWPVGYFKKQILLSSSFVWGCSLLFWLFMVQWGGDSVANKAIWRNEQTIKLILINLTIIPVGLLAQEFFFRGFLLKIFNDKFNKITSVIIVAILAGMFSMILAQSIFAWEVLLGIFILNVFLGNVALKFKSVIFSFFVSWAGLVVLNFIVLWQLAR